MRYDLHEVYSIILILEYETPNKKTKVKKPRKKQKQSSADEDDEPEGDIEDSFSSANTSGKAGTPSLKQLSCFRKKLS